MTMGLINLILGTAILIIANILLGSINAIFESEFDKEIFFKGILKGVLIVITVFGICFAGYLNPDTIAITVGTETLTILSGMTTLLIAVSAIYLKQVFDKLVTILVPTEAMENLISAATTEEIEQEVEEVEEVEGLVEGVKEIAVESNETETAVEENEEVSKV